MSEKHKPIALKNAPVEYAPANELGVEAKRTEHFGPDLTQKLNLNLSLNLVLLASSRVLLSIAGLKQSGFPVFPGRGPRPHFFSDHR
jgi:hypothetical protein